MRARRGSFARVWSPVVLAAAVACNAIVGIEDPIIVETGGECSRDADCALRERCLLAAERGSGVCISVSADECDDEGDCPGISICSNGECRNDCSADPASCLLDQRCDADGICRGTDPNHERPAGSGGSGAQGGSGPTAGTGGNVAVGGSGGSSGEGAGGGAGAGGAGGMHPNAGDECEEEGVLRCAGTASAARLVCEEGVWKAAEACGDGTLCDRASEPAGECGDIAPSCEGQPPGATLCDGAVRIACGPDLVSVDTDECASVEYCRQASGAPCATCLDGEYRCDGDTLSVCNDDHTGFDELADCTDEPCNETLGRCTTQICEADEYSCDPASNTLRLCNEDGTDFVSEQSCGTGICDAPNGECDDCVPDEVEGCADSARKRVCDDEGQGTVAVQCADEDPARPVCIGNGLCRQCTPSESECVDERRVRVCGNDGIWAAPAACTGQACAGDVCTGVCEPGATMCEDSTRVRTCSTSGQWGAATACTGGACVGTSCTGVCEPGQTRCEDKFRRQVCTSEGQWGTSAACSDQACVNGSCVGSCRPEETNCADKFSLRTCGNDGEWQTATTCTGQACHQDQCSGVCVPDDVNCTSATQYVDCNDDGTWSGAKSCSNQACVNDQCTGVCSPGAERCATATGANAPQRCNTSGAWAADGPECSATWDTICRVVSSDAQCVANPPVHVGEDTTFGGSTGISAGHLIANQVAIPQKVRVLKLGILIREAETSCLVRMAIFADSGGNPGARVAVSMQTPAALAVQAYELDPTQQTVLQPGTYWIAAHYQCQTTAYSNMASGEPPFRAVVVSYASGIPDTFPAPTVSQNTYAVSQYLVVQPVL